MKFLLDTCAIFYLSEQRRLKPDIVNLLDDAARDGLLFVSLFSAWEIGMLVSKGKTPITKNPMEYFESFVKEVDAKICSVDAAIMIGSHYLPAPIHGDPMDRLLVETARRLDLTFVTSDRAILAYGALGHVKTLAC
jgi:PIN domain nuclease of toxin-antitoxin system